MWTNVLLYVSTTYCLYPYDNAQMTYLQGCCHESDCKIGSQIFAFNSFKYISSNRMPYHMVSANSRFLEDSILFFTMVVPAYLPTNSA